MRWVVVDGIDGSGKSTIAHWMVEYYEARGLRAHLFVHPSERLVGRISRGALRSQGTLMHTIATLFFVGDVLASVSKKRSFNAPQDRVIFVRYLLGAAYLPEGLMGTGYHFFKRIIDLPRARLLVDVRPDIALSRIEGRDHQREMFENLQGLEETRRKVLILAKDDWEVLDNSGDAARTRTELIALLDRWESQDVPGT
jgi:dTMP kinase